ncbi:hypothetical protein BKA65DRAFT_281573 [Rhexocercosporidium sp. MPI-PUGE-AT-0058]|nr:hypothetical protein BKA65DRAFT_281573 [Rhexocercosporidium sp. MPI-PUGE-AT-0058]
MRHTEILVVLYSCCVTSLRLSLPSMDHGAAEAICTTRKVGCEAEGTIRGCGGFVDYEPSVNLDWDRPRTHLAVERLSIDLIRWRDGSYEDQRTPDCEGVAACEEVKG